MSKYMYDVVEVSKEFFNKMKIGDKHRGGVVAEGLGGLDDELLLVIGYEIVGDKDDPK